MEFNKIQNLLHEKSDLNARLNLIPYDGTAEIKSNGNGKYLYIRKRIAGKLESTYIGVYSDELYQILLRTTKEAREIRKGIRKIDKQLALLGYEDSKLDPRVILNIDFARANIKKIIYDQAILEGIGTTFPQTEDILDNGIVVGVKAIDVQKILNLKHAWEFILDKDVLSYRGYFPVLCNIARLVNEGFFVNGGSVRRLPVSIGGSSYVPEIPSETDVKQEISEIMGREGSEEKKAADLCLYCMKRQIFLDGNKRAAVIIANYHLISKGKGLLIIPEKKVPDFKKLLINYYEDEGGGPAEKNIIKLLKDCLITF